MTTPRDTWAKHYIRAEIRKDRYDMNISQIAKLVAKDVSEENRPISEAHSRERKHKCTVEISSDHEKLLMGFIAMLKTVDSMCSAGSSRIVKFSIDGDGSHDLKVDITKTDNIDEPNKDQMEYLCDHGSSEIYVNMDGSNKKLGIEVEG
jgi:hypothetical protein